MGEVSLLVRVTTGAFNGCSDQWPLVSRALAARALMGTIELKDNTIKARRLAARDSSAAGVQTIDFPGFMRDAVIAGLSFQCPSFFLTVQVATRFNHEWTRMDTNGFGLAV